jgi:hypothetical protein
MSIQKLKKLAREAELQLTFINDRIIVSGGKRIVTYWPESRRRTAYADQANQGVRHATPEQIIAMALRSHDEY